MPAKTFSFTLLLIGALALVWAGCSVSEDNLDAGNKERSEVLATVGSKKIMTDDLKREFNHYKVILQLDESKSAVESAMIKKTLLFRLIDELLLSMEAEKLKVVISEDELKNEIQSLLSEYDQVKLALVLAKNEMSFDEWKAALKKRLRIKKLVASQIDSKITTDEKEIKEFYKKNADEFKWPERVRALQIMVDDETMAEQTKKKLLSGADFAKMAKERSQSPDAVTGGDLGFFGRGQMPPEFEEAVFDLKPGQISEVIESIYGFHIFKVIKKEKPRRMTYNEAREKIGKLLFERKREEDFKNWILKIREKNPISVNQEVFSRVSS